MEKKHSDHAPSAAHRWMNCPGSVTLSKKAPPQPPSKYAQEGTDAHACLEFLVKNWGKATLYSSKKWPREMIDHCRKAAEVIFQLSPEPTAKLLVETKVSMNLGAPVFGTLDYAWVDDWGTLTIIDFKYGQGVQVDCFDHETKEENPQLMIYALGLARKYHFAFDRLRLVIIQPRIETDDGKPFSDHVISMDRLLEFEENVKKAIQKTRIETQTYQAGDWCRWCPAAALCPEISQNALERANVVFDFDTGVKAIPEPKSLTPKNLPAVLDACDMVENWIEKVREHAFLLAEKGHKIAGRKLVPKRSVRHWLPNAEQKAVKLFGSKVFSTEFLSPAQLEKRIGPKAKSFTAKYTTNISSGFSLVKESDKRGEVQSTLAFDLIETKPRKEKRK